MVTRRTTGAGGRVGIPGSRRGTSGLHRAGWWLTATLKLSAAAGPGTVRLDDVRVVRSARTPLAG
ncbi:hypothetical protein ACWDA9_26395, partial [Streptomyces sp. NPDC001193]